MPKQKNISAQPRVEPTSLRSDEPRRKMLKLAIVFRGFTPAPFGGSRKRWLAKRINNNMSVKIYSCFLIMFLSSCIIASCSSNIDSQRTFVISEILPSDTPTQAHLTSTQTATIVPLPSSTLLPSPTPLTLPVIAGTDLPEHSVPISIGNVGLVEEWARWGDGKIWNAAWSPDGRWLAFSSWIGLTIYDNETLTEQWFIPGNRTNIAFSADSQLLAVNSLDGSLRVYSIVSGEEIYSEQLDTDSHEDVTFSPDGKWLAAVGYDSSYSYFVVLWETSSQMHSKRIEACDDKTGIAFSPDSKTLACGDHWGDEVFFVDILQDEVIDTLHLDGSGAGSPVLAFIPNSKYFVVGDSDGIVNLWSLDGKEKLAEYGMYHSYVESIQVSRDGSLVAVKNMGGIELIDMTDLQSHWPFYDNDIFEWVFGMSFLSDNALLSLHEYEGEVDISSITLNGIETLQTLSWGDYSNATDIDFSPDSRLLAVANRNSLILWDITTGQISNTLTGYTNTLQRLQSLTFSSDGRLLATGGEEGTIRIWDVTNGNQIRAFGDPAPVNIAYDERMVYSLDFSPNGQLLAAGYIGGQINFWNIDTSSIVVSTTLQNSSVYDKGVRSLEFSPDGQWLVAGNSKGMIMLWDVAHQISTQSWGREDLRCSSEVAFSPSSDLLTWYWEDYDDNYKLIIWDINNKEDILKAKTESNISCQAPILFSKDEKMLASIADNEIKFWNKMDGKEINTLSGHNLQIVDIAFSPNGKWMASVSLDGTIRLWAIR